MGELVILAVMAAVAGTGADPREIPVPRIITGLARGPARTTCGAAVAGR